MFMELSERGYPFDTVHDGTVEKVRVNEGEKYCSRPVLLNEDGGDKRLDGLCSNSKREFC